MAIRNEQRLVAVYDTPAAARAAAAELQRVGVDPYTIDVDSPADSVASVRGEMRAEVDDSFPGSSVPGVVTREMARGSVVGAVAGGAIGLALTLPFAAFEMGDLNIWARLLIVAIVGITVGLTLGWVVGGGFGAKRPEEPLAAERGVTLAVPSNPATRTALLRTDPIRVDVVEPGGRPVTKVAERATHSDNVMRDLGRHMSQEKRRG
jgi:hypothetical protein